ncbi:MAG: radical SAM protein [Nanoarchaeota archaeon]|nr:radical SAM protein [Nanoarchaeota archaeon]
MKICLIQCPTWAMDKPPLGIAYLSAYLKSKGYEVKVFDFNIELFKKEYSKIGKLWEEDAHLLRYEESFFKILYPEIFENKYQINKIRKFFENKSKKEIRKTKFKQILEKKDKKPSLEDVKRIVKENVNRWAKRILNENPNLIGFSINGNTTLFSLIVAKEIRKINKSITIIFGGTTCHRDINAKFFLETGLADAVTTGEGEITLEKVAKQIKEKNKIIGYPGLMFKKENKIVDCGDAKLIKNLDLFPFPDYEEFNLKDYVFSDPLTFPFLMSRGCPYNCNFCLDTLFWKKYRFRSVDNIIKEFKQNYENYGVKHYCFNDLTINANINLLHELSRRLIKEDLKISWCGTARFIPGMTKDLIKNMKKSGCEQVDYGLESASETVLKRMNKSSHDKDYASKVLKWGHESGMRQALLLIIGYVNETEKEFNETLNFVLKNKKYLSEIHAGTLYLLKGTPVYENRKKLGIKLKERIEYPGGYEFCQNYNYQQYDWSTGKKEDEIINRLKRLNLFYKKLKDASIEHNLSGEHLKKLIDSK